MWKGTVFQSSFPAASVYRGQDTQAFGQCCSRRCCIAECNRAGGIQMPEARDLWNTQGTGALSWTSVSSWVSFGRVYPCLRIGQARGAMFQPEDALTKEWWDCVSQLIFLCYSQRCSPSHHVFHEIIQAASYQETKSYSPRHAGLLPRTFGLYHSKFHHQNSSLQSPTSWDGGWKSGREHCYCSYTMMLRCMMGTWSL